jgi:type II secretory pathway component GspD/PulD (secretin)
MSLVEELVQQVDTNVEDVTELRVFRLKNADPQEMADVLASLFPDPTTSNNQSSRGGQLRFGGGPFGGFGGGRQPSNDMSTRLQQQSKVTAVPDPRTGSIVVSASRDLMDQIGQMIAQLDADPAKKQKVFVYSVENTDPAAVEEILRGLFEGQNSRNRGNTRSTTRQTGNQLNNRATQNQNQGTRNSGFGNNTGGQFGR